MIKLKEILLVVIGLRITGLKKTGFVYFLGLFARMGWRMGGVISCVELLRLG